MHVKYSKPTSQCCGEPKASACKTSMFGEPNANRTGQSIWDILHAFLAQPISCAIFLSSPHNRISGTYP